MQTIWHFLFTFSFFCIKNVITLQKYNKTFLKKPPVVYGFPTNYGEAAYFVSVKEKLVVPEEDREYDNYCSGSIIKPKLVVSAAHCFVDRYFEIDWSIQNFHNRIIDRAIVKYSYVVAGQLRSSSERMEDERSFLPQWRAIKDVIVPKQYHYPTNDLALVKLKKVFYYNSNVQPIPYAKTMKEYKGLKCFIIGFSKISDLYKDSAPVLMKNYVEVVTNRNCKSLIHYYDEFTMLCSISKHKLTLEGDSGAPLICKETKDPLERSRGVLVGVLSGYVNNNVTIYTRVSGFYKYIKKSGKGKSNNIKPGVFNVVMIALFVIAGVII